MTPKQQIEKVREYVECTLKHGYRVERDYDKAREVIAHLDTLAQSLDGAGDADRAKALAALHEIYNAMSHVEKIAWTKNVKSIEAAITTPAKPTDERVEVNTWGIKAGGKILPEVYTDETHAAKEASNWRMSGKDDARHIPIFITAAQGKTDDVTKEMTNREIIRFVGDLCYTVWLKCHNPTHEDGNCDWFNDTLPTVEEGKKRILALLTTGRTE